MAVAKPEQTNIIDLVALAGEGHKQTGAVPGKAWSYVEARDCREMSAYAASTVASRIKAMAAEAVLRLGADPLADDPVTQFGAFDEKRRLVVAVWLE